MGEHRICSGVVAVLVTPLPGSQEMGSAGTAGWVSSHVANVNARRSNRFIRFEANTAFARGRGDRVSMR
ncbi:MAG: hypothetical protein GY871_03925 [Actinomycetales bacterium]|nr:hypothetical protein [Actinomycetales bacterium]